VATRIESRAQIGRLDDEGIIRVRAKPGVDLTLEDAQDLIQKLGAMGGGRRRPALIDLTGIRSISREARTYLRGPQTAGIESAAALLVGSPLSQVIGRFLIGFGEGLFPARLFTSELEALAWLSSSPG